MKVETHNLITFMLASFTMRYSKPECFTLTKICTMARRKGYEFGASFTLIVYNRILKN
jgi:hypothetical protein